MNWLQTSLQQVYAPVLGEPWILDGDATVKTPYGKQEGAEVDYNPHNQAVRRTATCCQLTLDAGCRLAKRQTGRLQTQRAGALGIVESHAARAPAAP